MQGDNGNSAASAPRVEAQSFPAAGMAFVAASTIALASAAARSSGRAALVPRNGVITTDSAGRFRFGGEGGSSTAAAASAPVAEAAAPRKLATTPFVPGPAPLVAVSTELGATAPFNFWDPAGLSDDQDAIVFRRRRCAELKNGRVAMIACIGYIVPEYFRWPGYCSPSSDLLFSDIPNGIAALYKIPAEGWAQMGVFVAFLELFPMWQDQSRAPGDFKGCGKFGVPWFFVAGKQGSLSDPVANKRSLEAEINNGRLAMVAIVGMITQNCYLGTTGPAMWF